jgi:predicted Zn-dependent protease with MMP-like domain
MGAGTWQVYRRLEALLASPRSGLRDSPHHARVRDDGRVVEMTREDFETAVSEGLDLVPADLAAQMDNVVVFVEDDAPADDPDLLGLYEGVPLTERDHMWAAGALPDRITIFRNPTLAFCETREDVVEEVAVTVVHEIAHHFGIDDDRLHELGWA